MTCLLGPGTDRTGNCLRSRYMLKENDQLTPLMLKEPLPGRQLVLAQHDSLTVSQTAERFIEMFTSI